MEHVGSTHKKQQVVQEEDDIINKLPESLISHILSFLPTKDAVRTSVLSKTWIERWTLITKVKFDDSLFYSSETNKSDGKQHFINFVSRALILTTSHFAESFSLTIENEYDPTLLNTWISCIMKKSVKEILISTNFKWPFSALTSHYLFSHCFSFEKLVLEMCGCAIKVPTIQSKFYFRSLKCLKLSQIIFNIDNSLGLNLDLPLLQTFRAVNCTWLCAKNEGVTIEAPLLESVELRNYVSREPHSCTIKFSATCMTDFTYYDHGGISQPIVLSDPSAARNASATICLYLPRSSYDHETELRVCLLLKQFSQVEYMKFNGRVLMPQNVAILPLFVMLNYLKLCSVTAEVLISLLQKSPVLNTLIIQGVSKEFNQEILNNSVVPACLASSLQVVKFKNVIPNKDVLFLAKFFLENAMVLEITSFSFSGQWQEEKTKEIKEFKEKVSHLRKESRWSYLTFHD